MDAIKSKRKFMKWVREQVRLVKNDPYLAPHGEHVVVEMVRWDKKNRRGLFVVYDNREGKVLWDTDHCKWHWIDFDSRFSKWHFFEMFNAVLVNARYPKTSSN